MDHGRKLPICLRKYESGNVECDGKPRSKNDKDRMPCVYRDRCVALQRLMKVKKWRAREILKLRKIKDVDNRRRTYAFAIGDSDEFQATLNRAIDRYGIRSGRVTIKVPQEDKPKKKRKIVSRSQESKDKSTKALKKARKFASEALAKKAQADLEATEKLVTWFIDRLKKKTDRKICDVRGQAEVGELFVVDRIESSRYVTVYCKTEEKKRRPVVCMRFKSRTRKLQFRLPLDPEKYKKTLAAGDVEKIGPASFSEGRFKCKTKPLDREGVSIVADSIAVAIRKSIMKLPKVDQT